MNRTEKEAVIGELHAKMAKAKAAILAEPKGLNVATVTELRRKCREAKVEYRIVKNTLAVACRQGHDRWSSWSRQVRRTDGARHVVRRRGRPGEDPRGVREGP